MEVIINSNLAQVAGGMQEAINRIVEESSPILLAGATSILALVHDRIHGEGLKADGSPLGQYSNRYLRLREKKYNRTADVKIIASLTRQMENDFTVVSTDNKVGLGFNNNHNGDKAGWIEKNYPGTYLISKEEERVFVDVISQFINDLFE